MKCGLLFTVKTVNAASSNTYIQTLWFNKPNQRDILLIIHLTAQWFIMSLCFIYQYAKKERQAEWRGGGCPDRKRLREELPRVKEPSKQRSSSGPHCLATSPPARECVQWPGGCFCLFSPKEIIACKYWKTQREKSRTEAVLSYLQHREKQNGTLTYELPQLFVVMNSGGTNFHTSP